MMIRGLRVPWEGSVQWKAPKFDSYWRPNDYHLTLKRRLLAPLLVKAGYKGIDELASMAELVRKKRRLDRGLLVYDNCSNEEVQRFLKDRGLPCDNNAASAVKLLEQADEELTFHNFLDLPPELRMSVYHFYMEKFPCDILCPSQPPLARTCRLLKQEVLPKFYEETVIELGFQCNPRLRKVKVVCHPDTSRFLEQFDNEQLFNFRYLQLNIHSTLPNDKLHSKMFVIFIDLEDFNDAVIATKDWSDRIDANTVCVALKRRLEIILDGCNVVNGRRRLASKHFGAMVRAMGLAMRPQ